jgi:hypothetical protein
MQTKQCVRLLLNEKKYCRPRLFFISMEKNVSKRCRPNLLVFYVIEKKIKTFDLVCSYPKGKNVTKQ